MNRGAGYGQEVPCIFRLYGPKRYIENEGVYRLSKYCWTTSAICMNVYYFYVSIHPPVLCPLLEVILYGG